MTNTYINTKYDKTDNIFCCNEALCINLQDNFDNHTSHKNQNRP